MKSILSQETNLNNIKGKNLTPTLSVILLILITGSMLIGHGIDQNKVHQLQQENRVSQLQQQNLAGFLPPPTGKLTTIFHPSTKLDALGASGDAGSHDITQTDIKKWLEGDNLKQNESGNKILRGATAEDSDVPKLLNQNN